jgi:HAD superfamily hydrolase (TIGR01490 family)
MKRKFAAFDIDGTIGRDSLFLQIVQELIDSGHIPPEAGPDLEQKLFAYKSRTHKHAFKDYTSHSVEVLFGHIEKLKVSDYRAAVDRVVARSHTYVYVYTRDLISKMKAEGYFLIALSGSEMYAVEQFMSKLFDFDVVIGEEYSESDGYFTGKATEVFHKKELYLKDLIQEHDLTIEGSFAVGDSAGDTTMLEFVENPVAFNPEDTLYEQAKANGWKIVVERKNVIYELESRNGTYVLA